MTPRGFLFRAFPDFSQESFFFFNELVYAQGAYIEIMDVRGKFGEHERSNYSLLSALQTSQVHHIADKIAFLLINCKILVTRGTEKQTLLLADKHATIVQFERKLCF